MEYIIIAMIIEGLQVQVAPAARVLPGGQEQVIAGTSTVCSKCGQQPGYIYIYIYGEENLWQQALKAVSPYTTDTSFNQVYR